MINCSKILITGGYGFIGAHLAAVLAEPQLNNQITLMDVNFASQTTGNDFKLKDKGNISIVHGSVIDERAFSSLPNEFDYIIHAAGFLGINAVSENQTRTLDTNVIGTRNCLAFAAKHEVKPRMLYFSSSEIYGVQCAGPAEYEPAVIPSSGGRWCYAASKLAGEYYIRAYSQQYEIKGGIVRPFNVFGPYRYGLNAMTALTTHAVYNNDLLISGDGLQVRSWCYIDDFCTGALSVLEKSCKEIEVFNIGDDRNVYTMVNLAQKIIEASGSNSNVMVLKNAIEDVFYRIPDIDKARNLLGYKPATDFEVALENVIRWIRNSSGERYGK